MLRALGCIILFLLAGIGISVYSTGRACVMVIYKVVKGNRQKGG